ncbi:phosphoribosylformylglycinamidine cyclo-ligase [Priestia taiwanensis]|uniref:Phosphoribosylformylglycinamidine cyclo-ligase n=1 Tax=Priestia taiwanensis TaxID=1347902 RepID=A0A917AWS4_9BACI|nr:phosphoribosylformylglycinamidine cyclo-ligase [Priestia taiwanensis]MBM7364830.1 phosphoribosylformylglycinamidine cyclo-ligase [Priestia taiwanensis]GGE80000.1 phosphoribosylformylglycinamidine cyclo-ligase [Priestia taiwanensis]
MANAYKQAGVDIEAGYEAVSRMKKHVQKTMRKEVLSGLGGFGGMFDLSATGVKEPVLVSGTDGVGTKLMLAFMMDKHDTIGIDAVAMCVNDIVVQGAEPLFFLDYIACGKAAPEKIESIVKGIADGCAQAGCALIGGETAEMPGMYDESEYDLAGFTVGVVEKKKIITGQAIQEGDVLIGLASSGIHSNGYSLVRKVLLQDAGLSLHETYAPLTRPLGEELLEPTRIYIKPMLEVLKQVRVKGMAHITGGGFIENIPRMLPEGLGAEIKKGTWSVLPIFDFLREVGNVPEEDMYNIFNMGIGMVVAVRQEDVQNILHVLEESGEKASVIGTVKAGEGVIFV